MLNPKNELKILKQIENINGLNEFVLYKSSKEECDRIKLQKFDTEEEIVAYGKSSTMDEKTAVAIMPEPKTIDNLLSKTIETSYKCWCCEKLNIEQFVGHKHSITSWECLMNSLGNPTYVIISQRKVRNNVAV
jgi:hypothetical protein